MTMEKAAYSARRAIALDAKPQTPRRSPFDVLRNEAVLHRRARGHNMR